MNSDDTLVGKLISEGQFDSVEDLIRRGSVKKITENITVKDSITGQPVEPHHFMWLCVKSYLSLQWEEDKKILGLTDAELRIMKKNGFTVKN